MKLPRSRFIPSVGIKRSLSGYHYEGDRLPRNLRCYPGGGRHRGAISHSIFDLAHGCLDAEFRGGRACDFVAVADNKGTLRSQTGFAKVAVRKHDDGSAQ